jgi:hypothetical protein
VSRVGAAVRHAARIVIVGVIASAAASASVAAQETVTITVPSFVSFSVTDVTRSTTGAPSPSTISFSSANLTTGKALRVSVLAAAAAFTPPSGASIPVSKVSWSLLGANGGTGMSGTLSSSSYELVFQSNPATMSGHVDLAWALAAPGSGIRAGTHQLTIRWKAESITP